METRADPSPKELAKLLSLTPADFARTATVEDDELETLVTISTVGGYQSNGRFTDRVRSDNSIRAMLDRHSDKVRYQVYQVIRYGGSRRDFRIVNYSTPDGPQSAELVRIEQKLDCPYGTCVYEDIVGFDVPEALLQTIAGQYLPGHSPFWRLRFKDTNGLDWEDHMVPAEAAGILAAVDGYRKTHPVRR